MKKIHTIYQYITVWILALTTLTSCNFLDTEPTDFAAPETFYKNEKECTMALAGVYWTMARENVYGNRYSCMISNVDDLSYYTRKDQDGQVFANSHNSGNGDIWNAWYSLYDGINNANSLLENIDNAQMDDKVRARIKGEAKFLRAYYHFLLVQGWYEVPIRKQSVNDIMVSGMAATPHTEALDWIIKEMQDCLPMVDQTKYDKLPSYVKKTVVEGILARVCLWRAGATSNGGKEFYDLAAQYAKSVYDSKKHSLNSDVYALWKNMSADKYDATFNESMWEVEFKGTRNDGSYTESRIGNVIGNLQENSALDGKGYTYAFYAGTLLLWDLFDAKDLRRDLSMAPYKLDNKDKEVAWKANQITERRCGKYRREWESSSPKHKNYTQANYCILRYADVLLMLAEAENEANKAPTTLAYTRLNQVRKRAGIAELSGLSYEDFRKAVRDERGRELCFESLRKYDLVRWGIYVKSIHSDLAASTKDPRWSKLAICLGAPQYADNTEEKHQFLPIPSKELSVNTLLEQNKYWR